MTDSASPTPPGGPGAQPAFNVPPVTTAAVLTIAGVFVVLALLPERFAFAVEGLFTLVPARVAHAVADPLQPGTLLAAVSVFSHALLHVDLMHLVANSGFLLAFGSFAERALGRQRYIRLLAVSVVAGAGVQLMVDWGRWVSLLGASSAASGCLGVFIRLMLTEDRPDPRRRNVALGLLAAVVLANLLFAVLGPVLLPMAGRIAWEAHLGGFVAGVLLAGGARRRP